MLKILPVLPAFLLAVSYASAAPLCAKAGKGPHGELWRCRSFKAVFEVPPGFELTPPKRNDDIAYDYALRRKKGAFEVRLQFSADAETPERAAERAACDAQNRKEPGTCRMADLEAPSSVWGEVMAANMNDGSPVEFFPFPADGVKAEFGADWGFVSTPIELDPRRSFNKGYKFGQVVVLHRRGVGKLYRIVLTDAFETLRSVDRGIFYHARFEGARPPGR